MDSHCLEVRTLASQRAGSDVLRSVCCSSHSTHLEVFSLNNLLVAIVLRIALAFTIASAKQNTALRLGAVTNAPPQACTVQPGGDRSVHMVALGVAAWPDERAATWGALCCGIALSNQHTSVLTVIPVAVWTVVQLYLTRRAALNHFVGGGSLATCAKCVLRSLLPGVLAFALGLLPYAYLVWSDTFHRQGGSWGDSSTFLGLARHLLRADYGTFRLHASNDAPSQRWWERTTWYLDDLVRTQSVLGYATLVLGGVGIFSMVGRKVQHSEGSARFGWLLVACWVFYLGVFHGLANMPLDDDVLFLVHARFWQQPSIFVWLLAGIGIARCLAVSEGLLAGLTSATHSATRGQHAGRGSLGRARAFLRGALCTLALAVALAQCQSKWLLCDASQRHGVEMWGRGVLASVSKRAILLSSDDLTWGSVGYGLHGNMWVCSRITLM